MNVAIKDLKNSLSRYLRAVRAGERIFVTDRGLVVAEIRRSPPVDDREEAALASLAAEGVITRRRGRLVPFAPIRPTKAGTPLSTLLLEDRD